jgi:exopolysaccharide biosynthesis predicted pyruvyltransferase EpsI
VCSILAVNKDNIINNNSNSNNIIIISIASTSLSKLQQQYTQSKPNSIQFIRQLDHIKRQILSSSSATKRVKTDKLTSHKALLANRLQAHIMRQILGSNSTTMRVKTDKLT